MVEVKSSIVITGLLCLTAIYIAMLLCKQVDGVIGATIVGAITFAIGAIAVPAPKTDKQGVLRW